MNKNSINLIIAYYNWTFRPSPIHNQLEFSHFPRPHNSFSFPSSISRLPDTVFLFSLDLTRPRKRLLEHVQPPKGCCILNRWSLPTYPPCWSAESVVESISLVLPSIRSLFVTKFSRISTQTAVRAKSAISRAIAPVQAHKFYPQLIFFFPKREFFTAAVPIPYVSYMAYAISCCTIAVHFYNNLHMYTWHSLCGLFLSMHFAHLFQFVQRIFFTLRTSCSQLAHLFFLLDLILSYIVRSL